MVVFVGVRVSCDGREFRLDLGNCTGLGAAGSGRRGRCPRGGRAAARVLTRRGRTKPRVGRVGKAFGFCSETRKVSV